MNEISIGDLAHGFLLRRQSAQLKQHLSRLTFEMASGTAADTSGHLGGRFDFLAGFERDAVLLESYRFSANEAGSAAAAMQTALETVQDQTGTLSARLILASTAASPQDIGTVAGTARGNLGAIVSALNASSGGRALFSGTAVSSKPLADTDTLLADLRTAVSGLTTAADVLAAADTFFDTSGGTFETNIYQGASDDLAPRDLGSGETVQLGIRADDPALRSVLKQAAVAALADDPVLNLAPGEARALMLSLAENVLGAQSGLTAIRADLGYAEERIETASVRISAEIASTELARNELISVDPYQTATELEAVQIQIETLYTITARSSRLSLVNFLT